MLHWPVTDDEIIVEARRRRKWRDKVRIPVIAPYTLEGDPPFEAVDVTFEGEQPEIEYIYDANTLATRFNAITPHDRLATDWRMTEADVADLFSPNTGDGGC